jgi:hypothetical protein
MKYFGAILFLSITCLPFSVIYGQVDPTSESLAKVSDSLLKKEIGSFTRIKLGGEASSLPLREPLIDIPLQNCSDSQVHLSLSKFNSSVSTFIHLYFKGNSPDRSLDSIFVVTHSHFWVKLPRCAYEGIYHNLSCDVSGRVGKKSKLVSPNYKAYYSANKRRMYIYMIAGSEGNKYEVTWVFVDDRYFTRILDRIQ